MLNQSVNFIVDHNTRRGLERYIYIYIYIYIERENENTFIISLTKTN